MPRIALIPGDGIGPEVIREAARLLHRVGELGGAELELDWWDLGADRYLRDGVTLSDEDFEALSTGYDAILLGALGDARVPQQVHARDILLGLRTRLDLYVNYRPSRLLHPSLTPLKEVPPEGIHLEIFRENTEGPYLNLGGRLRPNTPHEVAIQEDVNSWLGVERIIRAAFEHGSRYGRKVTLVDKANALPSAGALWRRAFQAVGDDFPDVERDALYVDAMALELVRRPGRYQVVVTSNLFGDILSDLAAGVTGGLGVAPSANIHPGGHALFEPVHGSAPDIVGTGQANPLAAIRCCSLLLEHLGYREWATAVEDVVIRSLEAQITTPDLGGRFDTEAVGKWIAGELTGPAGSDLTLPLSEPEGGQHG
ncbi:MAG: isocitrate/isopropylmalate family dehydrogenase [Gemmatimonadota bacterium]